MSDGSFLLFIVEMYRFISLGRYLSAVVLLFGVVAGGEVQTVSGVPTHTPVEESVPASSRTARNVILMIGDGMGAEHMWAAWLCNHGALNMERLPVVGMSRTVSASHAITDSAAAGTAIACGHKAVNGQVGVTPDGHTSVSVMQQLFANGRETGIVVTKSVTDATPAAFYAHADNRHDTPAIAADLIRCGCRVLIGGGAACISESQKDSLRRQGVLLRLVAPRDCPPASQRGDYLEQAVQEALSVLEAAPGGFFLLIEGASIDLAAHDNNLRETVLETLDFDRAVGKVLRWMKTHPDTLLVVTADHQTGGLSILGGSARNGEVVGAFSTRKHSGVAVPVFAAGAGAARFGGWMENTEFLNKILSAAACDESKVTLPEKHGK